MNLSTFFYAPEKGWSVRPFPPLDSSNTLVMAFAAAEYARHPELFQQLKDAYPQAKLIGCSTAGEIHGPYVSDGTISVSVMQFEHSRVVSAAAPLQDPTQSFAVGRELARQLLAPELRALFVLADGLVTNSSELVQGINDIVGPDVIVTGGLAADGDRFQSTWVLHDQAPQSRQVILVGLYGDRLRVTHGLGGGWDSFGPERRITRSEGRILYEVDGRPALALYKEYLGERASGLPAAGLLFPLSIRRDTNDTQRVVRTIRGIDEVHQALIFAGDVPQGYLAQLMRANIDRLIDGASDATSQAAHGGLTSDTTLSIAISCIGRRLVLGERSEEETGLALDNLSSGTQQTGFYSYGEISPHEQGTSKLHNQTMTITTFSEG